METRTARSPRQRPANRKALFTAILLTIIAGIGLGVLLNVASGRDDGRFNIIDRIRRELLTAPKKVGAPVNILLIGSDSRQGEQARSDTIIFMHVNYAKKRAYLVSIPRDTRVHIPDRGMDKINAAYAYGQAHLAIRTVETFLNVDLNHYVEIDFNGFKKVVDALGGIEVTVDKTINDRSREYRMYIPAGKQKMDGETALNYVRYRHGDSDFERAARQQNFMRALGENALTLGTVVKLPSLIEIFNENVSTDMSKSEMLSLAKFLKQMPQDRLETVTVPGESRMIGGISYVVPDRYALSKIFYAIEKGRSLKGLKDEEESGKVGKSNRRINVSILNGSGKAGLATQAKYLLSGDGILIQSTGNARTFNYDTTEINYVRGKREDAEILKRMFFMPAKLKAVDKTTSGSDIEIIIGLDYYNYSRS